MLDLDSLAEKRARTLNEGTDKWHQAVWSVEFQKISANMSDGEVETLLSSCKSVRHLNAVIAFLSKRSSPASPYTAMTDAATDAGLGLSEWIASLPGARA
jgi:hypothetical protein